MNSCSPKPIESSRNRPTFDAFNRDGFMMMISEAILKAYIINEIYGNDMPSNKWDKDPEIRRILKHIEATIDCDDLMVTLRLRAKSKSIDDKLKDIFYSEEGCVAWLKLRADEVFGSGALELYTANIHKTIKNYYAPENDDKKHYKNLDLMWWLFNGEHDSPVIDIEDKMRELDYKKVGKGLIDELMPKNEVLQKLFFPHYGKGFLEFRPKITEQQLKKNGLTIEQLEKMLEGHDKF